MATHHSVLKSTKKNIGISGGTLKFFAALMMTAYYFAVIIIHNGKLYGFVDEYYKMAIATEEGALWLRLYDFLVIFRHFSFPIFAFLLVEGFIHTSGFRKYFIRVFIVALISEVPYDLSLFNETINFHQQNPVFTLASALLVMYFMKKWRKQPLFKWLTVIVGCGIAHLAHFQFGWYGVLSIALMYNFQREKIFQMISGAAAIALGSLSAHFLPVLCFIPILLYNGERGRFNLKWFYYIYYPLMLTVFYTMIYIGAMVNI
jgi:hypothetical protein